MVPFVRKQTIQVSAWVHGALIALFLVSVPLSVGVRLKDALTVLFGFVLIVLILLLFSRRAKCTDPLKLLCSYILLVLSMWLIDLAHSGDIYSASIFAYRRLGYFLVAFSILLNPKVNSMHVGYPLLLFSLLHWVFAPKKVDQFGRLVLLGIIASRVTKGVLAAFGALLILQEVTKQRSVLGHALGMSAVGLGAWLGMMTGSKTAIVMLLTGLCVYIAYMSFTRGTLGRYTGLFLVGILASMAISLEFEHKLVSPLVNDLTQYKNRPTSFGQRSVEWIVGVREIGQWPTFLIGSGWGMLPEIVKQGVSEWGSYIDIPIQSIDHTFQSVFIDTLVAYGLLVGGAYLGFIGRLWLQAFKKGDSPILTVSLLPLIAVNSFSFGNGYEVVFWVGLMLALKSRGKYGRYVEQSTSHL
jgi:hypothetical protein